MKNYSWNDLKTLNEPNKVLIFIVENMENNYFGVF
jgi:hypothetical protein